MKKFTTLIFILTIYIVNSYAQTNTINLTYYDTIPLKPLTKQQMYEDFDTFIYYENNLFPFNEIIYKNRNENIAIEINDLRKSIDTISSLLDYYMLFEKIISMTNDGHFEIAYNESFSQIEKLKKFTLVDIDSTAIENTRSIGTKLGKLFNKNKFYFYVKYINGEYYTYLPIKKDEITYPIGLKLLKFNNQDIHKYIQKNRISLFLKYWDNVNKRYFDNNFYKSYSLLGTDSINFTFENTAKDSINISFPLNKELDFGSYRKQGCSKKTKMIKFIPETKTLFIRLPTMVKGGYSYSDTISNIFNENNVENVIFDVRGNTGGNDAVWEDIVSTLIGHYKRIETLCGKNTEIFKKYLAYHIKSDSTEFKTNLTPFLDSSYCCFNTLIELPRNKNNYNFKNKIYIFYDESAFSSTFSFLSFMKSFDNVITIGKKGGFMNYVGFNPFPFVLPNSKLIFKIPINFDIISKINLNDFNCNPDILINDTPESYYNYNSIRDKDYYNFNSLNTNDVYFKTFFNKINVKNK